MKIIQQREKEAIQSEILQLKQKAKKIEERIEAVPKVEEVLTATSTEGVWLNQFSFLTIPKVKLA